MLTSRFVAKLETMDADMKRVRTQLLSGHGTSFKKNRQRLNTTEANRYTPSGWRLPLFSKLQNQTRWLRTLFNHYRADFEAFGYSYKVDKNEGVLATCLEFDQNGQCI